MTSIYLQQWACSQILAFLADWPLWFTLLRFGQFWFILRLCEFRAAEKFKYLVFTAMKIHIMGRVGKETKQLIFSSLVT